ncbi:MAG TPA: zinc ribbon domain-containing protein [Gaiellaceae bacterium]|nr:zinc ribbon domain-containing protein [Gaiellaceae bacterium]
MSTRVDVEELQTTNIEKLLAVVLAVFLLIGGLWAYQEIDDRVRAAVETAPAPSPEDEAAIARLETARGQLDAAREHERQALTELELRREAYRTALDAGRPAAQLGRDYRSADADYERARAETQDAEREVDAARPAADAAARRAAAAYESRLERQGLYIFLPRLALVLAAMIFAYWLLGRLRRGNSRYLPVGFAVVGFAAILAFVMAVDYTTDYIDPLDLGPLVLSVVGIGLTLLSFAALQRYLARRVPYRRVRRRECPFCGYPVTDNEHCEGCGREVVASCTTCGNRRRVGTLHCATCGST